MMLEGHSREDTNASPFIILKTKIGKKSQFESSIYVHNYNVTIILLKSYKII